MQKYYSSFDAFASDLEYKTSKYVRVNEQREARSRNHRRINEKISFKKLQTNEDFNEVGTYPYMYISNTGDEYEDFMTDEEIDNAYNTNTFTDKMWLKGEAYITKEGRSYQVSWGEFDDYHEASSISACKAIVKKYHPYGFKWESVSRASALRRMKNEQRKARSRNHRRMNEKISFSWLDVQNRIARERDRINPFYDKSAVGDYILELVGKIERDLDLKVVPSVQGGYGDVYIHLGNSYPNSIGPIGPIDFKDFSNEMIDLILEADTENQFIESYKANILAYIPNSNRSKLKEARSKKSILSQLNETDPLVKEIEEYIHKYIFGWETIGFKNGRIYVIFEDDSEDYDYMEEAIDVLKDEFRKKCDLKFEEENDTTLLITVTISDEIDEDI